MIDAGEDDHGDADDDHIPVDLYRTSGLSVSICSTPIAVQTFQPPGIFWNFPELWAGFSGNGVSKYGSEPHSNARLRLG